MLLCYISLSGYVRDFVEKTGLNGLEIDPFNNLVDVDEDFVFIAPSYDDELTETIKEFIAYNNNEKHLKAIAGSGNLNFDEKYCFSADDLSLFFDKPVIAKFEYDGNDKDVENFVREVSRL